MHANRPPSLPGDPVGASLVAVCWASGGFLGPSWSLPGALGSKMLPKRAPRRPQEDPKRVSPTFGPTPKGHTGNKGFNAPGVHAYLPPRSYAPPWGWHALRLIWRWVGRGGGRAYRQED